VWGFKIMSFRAQDGALVERFQDTGFAVDNGFDLSAYISSRHNLLDLTEEGNKRGIQVLVGMGDVEEMGGALRGANAVASALQNQKKEEKERKNSAKRRQLQVLLDELADLNAQITAIDEQIDILEGKIDVLNETMTQLQDGSMTVEEAISDPDVSDAVKDWERRTGKKFDPNDPEATDILVAILAAQVDEYGNDIAALKRERTELEIKRDEVQSEVDKVVEMKKNGAAPEVVEAKTEEKSDSYVSGRMFGKDQRLTGDAVEEIGRDNQETHRDAGLNDQEDLDAEDAFGGFDLGPSDNLAAKTGQLTTDFNVANAEEALTNAPIASAEFTNDMVVKI